MFKRITTTFLIVFVLLATYCINSFLEDNPYISTFKTYTHATLKISQNTVNNYFSNNDAKKNTSKESIITTTLKNLNYEKWMDYIDYIEPIILKGNILPYKDDELIVGLNLSKDLAVIAVYQSVDNEYVFSEKIEHLLPLQNIDFLKNKNLDYDLLLTHQLLDERLGAFFIEEFVEIFLYSDASFKNVFKKTQYKEEIYNAQWLDPSAPGDKWILIIEDNPIQYNESPLGITILINQQKYEAKKQDFPYKEDFKLIENTIKHENYYFSPKYQTFIMKEATLKGSKSTVAIIDDTSHWLSCFLGFESNNYKVITTSGQIQYVKKQSIELLDSK